MFGNVSAVGSPTAPAQSGLGSLDSEVFLKLLTAQMRFQDPLAPTDSSAMMQQTAAFTQVERLQEIASAQQQLLSTQMAAIAGDLVGRDVTAENPDGTTVEGTVDSVRYTADGPVLSVGEHEVALHAITSVSSAADGQSSSASA